MQQKKKDSSCLLIHIKTYVKVRISFWSDAVKMSPMVQTAWPNNDIYKKKLFCRLHVMWRIINYFISVTNNLLKSTFS